MQSVGEAMAIGRTFKQAFVEGDALARARRHAAAAADTEELLARLETPSHDRYELLFEAIRARRRPRPRSASAREIDPWFVAEIAALARGEDPEAGLVRTFKSVDTCAAEFEAATPYYYSGWERPAGRATRCGAATSRRS